MHASLETDVDYFDDLRDISSKNNCLVRLGPKTFAQTGTYITIKFYEKDKESGQLNKKQKIDERKKSRID